MSRPQSVCEDTRRLRFSYLPADFKADFSPLAVMKSVAVEAGAANPLGETHWLQLRGDADGYPTAIVARASLDDPDIAQTRRLIGIPTSSRNPTCYNLARRPGALVTWTAQTT